MLFKRDQIVQNDYNTLPSHRMYIESEHWTMCFSYRVRFTLQVKSRVPIFFLLGCLFSVSHLFIHFFVFVFWLFNHEIGRNITCRWQIPNIVTRFVVFFGCAFFSFRLFFRCVCFKRGNLIAGKINYDCGTQNCRDNMQYYVFLPF